jgi:chromosome segregation ATPase
MEQRLTETSEARAHAIASQQHLETMEQAKQGWAATEAELTVRLAQEVETAARMAKKQRTSADEVANALREELAGVQGALEELADAHHSLDVEHTTLLTHSAMLDEQLSTLEGVMESHVSGAGESAALVTRSVLPLSKFVACHVCLPYPDHHPP